MSLLGVTYRYLPLYIVTCRCYSSQVVTNRCWSLLTVSEEELRMIVMGAKVSGQIRTEEQDMIESVLDLQDTLVTAIM